jgi:hypothetical protein
MLQYMQTFTREYKPGSPFAREHFGRYGGRLVVKAGLWHPGEGSEQAPHVSVTCDLISDEDGGTDVGGGAAHDLIVAAFPKLARLIRCHLASVEGGPMYYIENALFWWEYVVGLRKPSKSEPSDRDYAAFFKQHTLWGIAPGDEADPLAHIYRHEIGTKRDILKERLRARLPFVVAEIRSALVELDIDPDWDPRKQ